MKCGASIDKRKRSTGTLQIYFHQPASTQTENLQFETYATPSST